MREKEKFFLFRLSTKTKTKFSAPSFLRCESHFLDFIAQESEEEEEGGEWAEKKKKKNWMEIELGPRWMWKKGEEEGERERWEKWMGNG